MQSWAIILILLIIVPLLLVFTVYMCAISCVGNTTAGCSGSIENCSNGIYGVDTACINSTGGTVDQCYGQMSTS